MNGVNWTVQQAIEQGWMLSNPVGSLEFTPFSFPFSINLILAKQAGLTCIWMYSISLLFQTVNCIQPVLDFKDCYHMVFVQEQTERAVQSSLGYIPTLQASWI